VPVTQPEITAEDVAVTLAVRHDLGEANEAAVIAEFLERVGKTIDERVDARVAAQAKPRRSAHSHQLPFLSLVFGIPITAIASSQGLAGMLAAWGGIAAINLADALRR
jgi:hypothetical protein